MADSWNDQIQALESMLALHQHQLAEGQAILNREMPIVVSLRNTIAAMKRLEAGPEAPVEAANQPSPDLTSQTMPRRKAEYAQMTIVDSIRHALSKWTEDYVHVDQIVREIYLPIADNDQFYRVKRTVVSETIRGMDKGLFKRDPNKANTFGLVRAANSKAA